MGIISESNLKIIKIVLKRTKDILGEIITKHICSDIFKDKQSEKRIFLTDIEINFIKEIDKYLKQIEEDDK